MGDKTVTDGVEIVTWYRQFVLLNMRFRSKFGLTVVFKGKVATIPDNSGFAEAVQKGGAFESIKTHINWERISVCL
jgi:hypothetical protein